MSHKIHTTEALILGSEPFGEANRWYLLFTPDLGLARARAQGVRLAKSKLAGQLLSFDHVLVSLVRGKDGWHLVGAESCGLARSVLREPAKRAVAAKIMKLLQRLIVGEEADPKLFAGVVSGINYLAAAKLTDSLLYHYELVMVLRVLANLGYIGRRREFDRLADFRAGWEEVLLEPSLPETALLGAINEALRHSHL